VELGEKGACDNSWTRGPWDNAGEDTGATSADTVSSYLDFHEDSYQARDGLTIQ
jgi:hypothetical protein